MECAGRAGWRGRVRRRGPLLPGRKASRLRLLPRLSDGTSQILAGGAPAAWPPSGTRTAGAEDAKVLGGGRRGGRRVGRGAPFLVREEAGEVARGRKRSDLRTAGHRDSPGVGGKGQPHAV